MSEKTPYQQHLTAGPDERLPTHTDGLAAEATAAAAAPSEDLELVAEKASKLTVDEARQILVDMLVYHEYDYNFPQATRDKMRRLLDGPPEKGAATADHQEQQSWSLELRTEAALNRFYSPYPEVRAVATPDDDPDMICETVRAHLLGYAWAVIGQFINSLFTSRWPNISLSSSVLQILLYPCGRALAWLLPDWGFRIGGRRVSLNPGPWTYKEQMLTTIIVSISLSTAYVFQNLQTQELFYQDSWLTPAYRILLLLSTQMMGIGFAGLMRRFVVYPVEAIWPAVLPIVALNRALLLPETRGTGEPIHGWTMSRYKFFFITFTAALIYFWIPNYLFTALSTFAWMCWIAPRSFSVNIITGSQQGLGLNPLPTFDWNTLNTVVGPLQSPLFATMQQFAGAIIGFFIIIAIYFTNTSFTGHLPINSFSIFNNTGGHFDIHKILVPGTAVINQTAYENYSPAFYSAGALMKYGAFFIFYPLSMVFICLDAWRPLVKAFRSVGASAASMAKRIVGSSLRAVRAVCSGHFHEAGRELRVMLTDDKTSIYDGFSDSFTDAMRRYPEVPDWWFLSIALISFIFAIIILTVWTQLDAPVWTIFFVVGLNLLFLVPMSYLYAIAGMSAGLNIITELVVGYALPGHPEALMFVKAYGFNINAQADTYIGDLKMGIYAKIPPRAMYRGQVIATLLTTFVCYAVVEFVDHSIAGICTPAQPQRFSCAGSSAIFFSSSVVWGALGPERVFTQLYPAIKWCFLFGFILAVVWWVTKRFGPRLRTRARSWLPAAVFVVFDMLLFTPVSWLRDVHPSLVLLGLTSWTPSNLSFWFGSVYLSLIFMWYIRRYKLAWWEKYNYILAAGLSGGVAFSAIIIFFAVQWKEVDLNWWGNTVNQHTMDGGGGEAPLVFLPDLPAKGYFGPDKWY